MLAIAFIDYDNIKAVSPERSHFDSVFNVEQIVVRLVQLRNIYLNGVDEISVRLYGGWIDEFGRYTTRATWLLTYLSALRGRRFGLRIRLELVVATYVRADIALIGTYRVGQGVAGQKMVDTLLAADLLHIAEVSDCPMVVLTDDEDVVPPMINIAKRRSDRFLVRNRAVGKGLNDDHLTRLGVSIVHFS